jgi:hypothetical protein
MNTEISHLQAEKAVLDISIKYLFHPGIGGCRIFELLIIEVNKSSVAPD